MDRARRAEPFSNATIWTREIARNLAGHLDRLSKVHSCVDSSSPKTAHTSLTKHGNLPLKRAGQMSPLRLDHSAPAEGRCYSPNDDSREELLGLDSYNHEPREGLGGRESEEAEMCSTPVRRRRVKALKKMKIVPKRPQSELDELDRVAHENQRLVDRTGVIDPASDRLHEYLEPAHGKSAPTQDYHKRQEQQRIWQENQALAKRLRNTKPTLSSKKWEKDDKWNQDFLKKQERRRQALHHEMARSLASPHSALIRVKQVVHPSSHGLDSSVDDPGAAVAALEVTTRDCPSAKAGSASKDMRRRWSVGEDSAKSRESRHHSTAPNHRRILELRRQKERPTEQSSDTSGAETGDMGPLDELVSVRFTFSREGHRAVATPNGITGQFSPAVELEAALESSCCDDALLLPVPVLDPPQTSRLNERADEQVEDSVLCALQACIDCVAAAADECVLLQVDATTACELEVSQEGCRGETSRDPDDRLPVQSAPTAASDQEERGDDSILVHAAAEPFEEVATAALASRSAPPLASEEPTLDALKTDPVGADALVDSSATEEVYKDEPSQLEMEASGYGSEFEFEETPPPDHAVDQAVPPVAEDDEYEDDDHTTIDEPALDQDHDLQYEDDLEPETDGHGDAEPQQEQSYADDGFADDD